MNTIFDGHFHIIDSRYPLIENSGFIPEPYSLKAYYNELTTIGLQVKGGTIVSGSFQGYDQRYLLDLLKRLPETFVGVCQIPFDSTETDILKLDAQRVRGVRFNLFRNDFPNEEAIIELANRVYQLVGWHTELYLDGEKLPQLIPMIRRLPQVVIDHLGLNQNHLLLQLLSEGVYVKVTGFGRLSFDPVPFLKELVHENENLLIFGSDLPSTRAKRRFSGQDVALLKEHFSCGVQQKIFLENGWKFYLR